MSPQAGLCLFVTDREMKPPHQIPYVRYFTGGSKSMKRHSSETVFEDFMQLKLNING